MSQSKRKRSRSTRLKSLPAKFSLGILRELDGRTATAQRLADCFESVTEDLGGADGLSHIQLAMCERFCFLEAALQSLEARIAENPEGADDLIGRWIQAVNSLTGLARLLGLERQARKAPNLRNYIASRSPESSDSGGAGHGRVA